ncbi:MAG: hypothetical protein ACI4HI_07750 [Lachnospiraceae bacterium]
MSEQEISKDILAKAKQTGSVEELLALAKENELELTQEQAEEYFVKLHQTGELADDELDNVAGGGCSFECEKCGSKRLSLTSFTYHCMDCGHVGRHSGGVHR